MSEKENKTKSDSLPQTLDEAIEFDEKLTYISIDKEFHEKIASDLTIVKDSYQGFDLNEEILDQIRKYALKEKGTPQLIIYDKAVLKVVSSFFKRISLKRIFEETSNQFGRIVKEQRTKSGFIIVFEPMKLEIKNEKLANSEYNVHCQDCDCLFRLSEAGTDDRNVVICLNEDCQSRNVEIIGKHDRSISPVVIFSYNLAERSFQFGFIIGIFYCQNQLFTFCGSRNRVVHNINHMTDFNLTKVIQEFKDQVNDLSKLLEESETKEVEECDFPVLYWKSSMGKLTYLNQILEKHSEETTKTLWQVLMNVTWVTTHAISNDSVSFLLSKRCGNLLCDGGKIESYDYIQALGFYMKYKANEKKWRLENRIESLELMPLKKKVISLLNYEVSLAEMIIQEKKDRKIQDEKERKEHVKEEWELMEAGAQMVRDSQKKSLDEAKKEKEKEKTPEIINSNTEENEPKFQDPSEIKEEYKERPSIPPIVDVTNSEAYEEVKNEICDYLPSQLDPQWSINKEDQTRILVISFPDRKDIRFEFCYKEGSDEIISI